MPTVSIELPREPDVLDLFRRGDEYALSLYPAESYYGLAIGELEKPGVTLFVAREAGAAVGTVALADRGDGTAEIKRMFVADAARGLGVATLMLNALELHALASGITLVQLETGPKQPAAIALYEKHGYAVIPNFGQYVGDDSSICMEKPLALSAR